jgi:predicted unusual protein kinase regulating ubiquinone biosynthesis (AarF/ABC1/UbiB family)
MPDSASGHDSSPSDKTPSEDENLQPPPPTGRGKRFFKLGALSSKVAASYMGNTIGGLFRSKKGKEQAQKRTHLKNAERLSRAMGELKGAVMKVGQLLSIQDGFMPIELRDTLAQFHASAPPMHFLFVKDTIESELNKELDEAFAEFDRKPLAAASLGQVHRAKLPSGEDVVVKVQYPGIEETIESDLKNMRRVVKSMRVGGSAFDMTEAFEEVKETLLREADYRQEADAIDRFGAALVSTEKVVVPAVYRSTSSQRVLTMDFLKGQHLDEYVEAQPNQDLRDEVGLRLARTIWELEFCHGLLHADPHPGNYIFMPDGHVGVIDFGCVKYFTPEFLDAYRDCIRAILAKNDDNLVEAYIRMKFLKPEDRGTKVAKAYVEWSYFTCLPLLHDGIWEGDWETFLKEINQRMNQLALKFGFYMPKDSVYLTRVLIGVMCFWNRLNVRINWNRLIHDVMDMPVQLPPA